MSGQATRMKVLQSGYGWEAQTGLRLGRNGRVREDAEYVWVPH